MSDIVDWLRGLGAYCRATPSRNSSRYDEAADEIERLRGIVTGKAAEAEIEQLREALRTALELVDTFASGTGWTRQHRASYEQCERVLSGGKSRTNQEKIEL
jgi:hypothetical protein